MLKLQISHGDMATALKIMREAATWLLHNGQPLWPLEDLTAEKLLAGLTPANFHVGSIGAEPAVTVILQWRDPFFWPAAEADSGFIHKLAVRRRFAGLGLAAQMVEWAKDEARRQGKSYLRLDCAADRPKLCAFYETLGFRQVERRRVATFDMAFYECRLG